MKYIVVCLLILIPIFCFSQNLQNLDLKYGFNKFKLEGKYQTYKNNLKYFATSSNGVKFYQYKGKDISVFGSKDINEINLGFWNDKLYNIDIDLNPMSEFDLNSMFQKLVELFGNPQHLVSYTVKNKLEAEWSSEKTVLGYDVIRCNDKLRPCHTNIFMLSKKLGKEIANNQF